MDYNACKVQLDRTHRECHSIKNKLRQVKDEIKEIEQKQERELNSCKKVVEEERKIALQKHVNAATTPVKTSIAEINSKIDQLTAKHQSVLQELEQEASKSSITTENENYVQIKEALGQLEASLTKQLGPRFKEELLKQLNSSKAVIEEDDLPEFIHYFNKLNDRLEKLNKRRKYDLHSVLGKVSTVITSERLQANHLNYVILLVVAIIMSFLFTRILFPLYTGALCILVIKNAYNSFRTYESILAFKSVRDNLNEIDIMFREKALAKIEVKRDAENKEFNRCLSRCRADLEEAEKTLERCERKSKADFVFDSDEVIRPRMANVANLKNKKDNLKRKEEDLKNELDRLCNRVRELETTLNKIAGDIPKKYLSPDKVGTEVLFNNEFLFDIEDNTPVFFVHPKESCLFVYNDSEDMINFIKLICLQLRTTMKPTAFEIKLFDKLEAGMAFQPFVSDTYSKCFSIFSTAQDVKGGIEELGSTLNKRVRIIKGNIEEYNQRMLEQDSVPEFYIFSFLLNPTQSELQQEGVLQALRIGGKLGMFTHLFIQKNKLQDLRDTAKEIIEAVGQCYELQNGKYHQRASDFLLEKLLKK